MKLVAKSASRILSTLLLVKVEVQVGATAAINIWDLVANIFVALLNFFTLLNCKLSQGKFNSIKNSKIICLT
jgi:hypothetical protein